MRTNRSTPKEDLAWLFTACESEMGIRSNFDAVIIASKIGTQKTRIDETGSSVSQIVEGIENEDRVIEALDIRRSRSRMAATAMNRRVMASYAKLHVMHQRVLEHAYECRQLPPEVVQLLGDAAGIAPITATARSIPKFTWGTLATLITRRDPKARAIKQEADRMLKGALEAYERATRETPLEPEPPSVEPLHVEPAPKPIKGRRKAEEASP